MSIGNLSVGQAKVCTAGFSGNVKSGQGAMLGFFASVAGTANIYDDAATGTTVQLASAIPIAQGWNAFPAAFANGLNLVLTTAAGTLIYV